MKTFKNKRGFVVLIAIILATIILAITMGVLQIALKEINFSSSALSTGVAQMAADAGIECALFNDKLSLSKFPIAGPATAITCLGASITPTFSGTATTGMYDFVLTGLGNSTQACAKVNIFKDNTTPPMSTKITAKGYNIGDGSCNSTNPNRLERELVAFIGDSSPTPSPPPPPPAGGFPTVAGTTGSLHANPVSSHTVALPASASGDLLIVFFTSDGNPNISWPSGWTVMFSGAPNTTNKSEGAYRIADGSESGSILVGTSVAEPSAHQSFRITGYTGTPEDNFTTATSGDPNSPNLNPSGWDVEKTLWISAVGRGAGTNVTTNSWPSGYTSLPSQSAGTDGTGATQDSAYMELEVASEDPGNYTVSSGQIWLGATVAVRGGASTPPPTTYTVTPSAGANGSISPSTPQTVNSGSTTTFTVTPNANYTASVGGTCGGSLVGTTYTTNAITANCTVSATFTLIPPTTYALTVTKSGTGSGTVTGVSNPSQTNINCGSTCSLNYTSGTTVTLSAAAGGGSTFAGWSGGGCSGTGTCIVTMSSAQNVTATFNLTSSFPTIATTNTSSQTSDSLSHTVNLPSGISSGDLLLVIVAIDGNPTVTWPGAWTRLSTSNVSASGDVFEVGYKIATGSDTLTLNTSNAQRSVHHSFRITGYTSTPQIAVNSTASSSNAPNPPNLSPTWGLQKTLWIAAAALGPGTNVSVSGYPGAPFPGTGVATQSGTDYTGASLATATANIEVVSTDPGNFTLSSSVGWGSATIAIQGI